MPALIGNLPNQVPTNGDLGSMAFQDSTNLSIGSAFVGGNLLLGGTTAQSQLTVYGTAAPAISISKLGDAGAGFQLGRDGSTLNAFIIQRENADLFIRTNNTERMRITAAGDVGIGTASPGAKLEVTGAIRSLRSGSTAALLQVINDNNSWNLTSGTSTAQFRIDNNLLGTALTINSNSNLILAGGTSTASGVGITFPATQSASSDANCLDDYEEGTWTPTIDVGSGTVSYTYQFGNYVKIGKVVTVAINVVFSASTSGAQIQRISLPFTAAYSTASRYPAMAVPTFYNINTSGGTSVEAYTTNGSTSATFHSCGNNTGQLVIYTTTSGSMELRIIGSYFTS